MATSRRHVTGRCKLLLSTQKGPRKEKKLIGDVMAEVDPETLLEWLAIGQGDERDIQLLALEQLCMLLLMSDNVDKCFEM